MPKGSIVVRVGNVPKGYSPYNTYKTEAKARACARDMVQFFDVVIKTMKSGEYGIYLKKIGYSASSIETV